MLGVRLTSGKLSLKGFTWLKRLNLDVILSCGGALGESWRQQIRLVMPSARGDNKDASDQDRYYRWS